MAHLSRYLKIYPSTQKPGHVLLCSTLSGAKVLIPETLLDRARSGLLDTADADTLKRLGLLVDDPAEEREQVRSLLERINGNKSSFRATVVLNLDCNLDCGYCYEGQFRDEQYMSKETAQLLVDMLVRDHLSKGTEVILTFYGGEPLLSEDLIRLISLQLQEAAKAHGAKYSFNLVTNGTLLNRDAAERLIPFGLVGAKLTLDGPRDIHDRQRPYATGSGSYDTIVENIASVCDIVRVQVGGNYYEENYREFPRLLDDLIACGVTPEKLLRLQFSPVTPQAGCADHTSGCASSTAPWLMEATPLLREEIMKRGFVTPHVEITACMVELENVVLIRHDGSLYKCPGFMGWEELSVGNLANGLSDYSDSHCLGNWQVESCLECAYLPLCFGGCRLLNLMQGKPLGDLDCRKEFYDATLETFFLQDMLHAPAKPGQAVAPPTAAATLEAKG